MPAYRYEVATAEGAIQLGVLTADSPRHARTLLRQQGLIPLEVDVIPSGEGSRGFGVSRLPSTELALATRQLASLLAAGLPVEQALNVVVEQAEKPVTRDRFASIRSEVVAGQTFSQALEAHPKDFPEVYCALIAAGEHSGDLAAVMMRLADYMDSRTALSQKVMLAFIYPVIVTVVAGLVIIALLTYVVPQVVGVFEQTQQKLPVLTIGLIAISGFVRRFGWIVLLGLFAAVVGFRFSLRSVRFRYRWHSVLLRLPVIGRLTRGLNSARFAATLGILASSGVPLVRALDAGARTLLNDALRKGALEAMASIREGAPLSGALRQQKIFPPVMVHLIASGESTGKLPEMLERAAAILSRDSERRTLILTGMLEPLLILVMGVIVLLIVLSVMMPIMEINQLVH